MIQCPGYAQQADQIGPGNTWKGNTGPDLVEREAAERFTLYI